MRIFMNLIMTIDDLPEKIKLCVLENYSTPEQAYIFSFKTSCKPNPTIPILWFVQLKDRISFCNTHKTRSIYKEIINSSINSIRLSKSSLTIEIIYKSLDRDDFVIAVEKTTDFDEIKQKLTEIGFEVTGYR
jgi:hypothetical protein